jgi:purine-binding chemotaxis protein CheW
LLALRGVYKVDGRVIGVVIMEEQDSKAMSKLFFKTVGKLFCIELNYVARIINLVELQSMPGAPSYFKGFLNLHQKEIPVIDLAERLGFKDNPEYNLNTLIVLCESAGKNLGLIVDAVLNIESIAAENLQEQELFKGESVKYLRGIINTPQGDALLLNMDNLFKLDF